MHQSCSVYGSGGVQRMRDCCLEQSGQIRDLQFMLCVGEQANGLCHVFGVKVESCMCREE